MELYVLGFVYLVLAYFFAKAADKNISEYKDNNRLGSAFRAVMYGVAFLLCAFLFLAERGLMEYFS